MRGSGRGGAELRGTTETAWGGSVRIEFARTGRTRARGAAREARIQSRLPPLRGEKSPRKKAHAWKDTTARRFELADRGARGDDAREDAPRARGESRLRSF
eukprot:31269-Pelagococcus_subviridis.AAC.5